MTKIPHATVKQFSAWTVCFMILGFGAVSHAGAAIILTGGGLTLLEEGPPAALNGDPAPANLATGKTPFGSSEYTPPNIIHKIVNVNDGQYGNSHSWINNGITDTVAPFIGIDLGATPITVNRIAFGRSNVLGGDSCGVCQDRNLGLYTLQFTRVPNPTAGLVTTGNAVTGWADIGTLNNTGAGGANFAFPHQRHLYGFNPLSATGLRLITPNGNAIDEIELYHVPEPVPTLTEWGIFLLILLLAGAAFLRVRRLQPTSVF